MKATYANNLFQSVFLWAEHCVNQSLQSFNVVTTPLYYTPDPSLPAGYNGYSAPLKSWVYDSGVTGAYIINSVSGGDFTNYPLTRSSGIHIDYVNGRVIVPSSFGTNLALTGTYSAQQVNFYAPSESEEQILTQNKYFLNPRYGSPLNSGIQPYKYATPAVFINTLSMTNTPFEFGGLVNSRDTMTFTVLMETNFQLTALFSLFRDTRYQYLPMLNLVDDPLNQWGDVKGGDGTGYNYLNTVATFGQPGNLIYISDTRTTKVSDKLALNARQFAGIIDLEMNYVRQVPLSSNVFV